jgi:hypothetical protein
MTAATSELFPRQIERAAAVAALRANVGLAVDGGDGALEMKTFEPN